VVEEVARLKSFHSEAAGEDLFLSVYETTKERTWIALDKLNGATTDEVPSTIGNKTGLMDSIGRGMDT
jgi:hypothetical protein